MENFYRTVTEFLITSGKRLCKRTGKIEDIGKLKADLTEEDLRIEHELTELITTTFPDHKVFAEEEHSDFESADNVWVIDPISGTGSFIKGVPHYGVVVTHLYKGRSQFAAIYDPSMDELFTAHKGRGAKLNNQPIHVSSSTDRILFNLSKDQRDSALAKEWWQKLYQYNTFRYANSFAVSYAWVAAGRFDGVVALTKDAFPEYAGQLIVEEAGGIFTTNLGQKLIQPIDRFFMAGNSAIHSELLRL